MIVKEQLIKAFEFPRHLIRNHVGPGECRFHGNYSGKLECRLCGSATECQWLAHHDEFSSLADKPTAEVATALEFAVDFIESTVVAEGHDSDNCPCESCKWLRDSRTMLDDYNGDFADLLTLKS